MAHRFLDLSDIHFGQEKDGTLVRHDHVRNALVGDVKKLSVVRGPGIAHFCNGGHRVLSRNVAELKGGS